MNWKTLINWLNRDRQLSRTHQVRKARRPQRTRICVECLENRYTPSSISGTVLHDLTGNGQSADDTAYAGVRVELFRDLNHDGVLDAGDGAPVALATSGQDGSYAFTNLSANTYFVREVLPFGDVRTAPVLTRYYTVNLAAGTDVTGQDFDSFHKPSQGALTNVYFLINGTTKVTTLNGNVHQGDTVQAFFTVRSGHTAEVSLVSYRAPGATLDPTTESQDVETASQTGTFGPGTYSLTVQVPSSFFQVDFVLGPAIDHFGPAGSNIFYGRQGRLLSRDTGGTTPYVPPASSLSGIAFLDNNQNGVFDFGDQGLVGVTVTLTDAQGNVVATQVTGNDGSYHFTNLAAGTYTITETRPGGLNHEAPKPGTGATFDGSVTSAAPASIVGIILDAGQDGINFNFGEQGIPNA
jgi:hypothetical protein